MAGSWGHATNEQGQLLSNQDIVQMLENGGDWYEFAEHVYGMVWYLANLSASGDRALAAKFVKRAEESYRLGIELSPGLCEREGE